MKCGDRSRWPVFVAVVRGVIKMLIGHDFLFQDSAIDNKSMYLWMAENQCFKYTALHQNKWGILLQNKNVCLQSGQHPPTCWCGEDSWLFHAATQGWCAWVTPLFPQWSVRSLWCMRRVFPVCTMHTYAHSPTLHYTVLGCEEGVCVHLYRTVLFLWFM